MAHLTGWLSNPYLARRVPRAGQQVLIDLQSQKRRVTLAWVVGDFLSGAGFA